MGSEMCIRDSKRALLADSRSVLSGVAFVQLLLVHREADNSTLLFIVDHAKQCT